MSRPRPAARIRHRLARQKLACAAARARMARARAMVYRGARA